MSEMFHGPCLSSAGAVRPLNRTDTGVQLGYSLVCRRKPVSASSMLDVSYMDGADDVFLRVEISPSLRARPPELRLPDSA